MGFDGSSITGFNAIEESDMIAMPDAGHVRRAALAARRQQGRGAAVLRRRHPEPRALRGRPAPRAAPRARAGGGDGLRHLQRRAPSWSSSTSATRARSPASPEILDEGGYFDLTTLDAGSDVRRETVLALEELGIHVEYTHHEVGPSPARDRHALRRRAEDGRRLHDLPHHREGVRHEVRVARDLHAQAAVRRERLGDAHPPVAVQGRQERLLRRRRPVLPLRRGQGVHRGPAAPRARDLARSSPSG